MPQYKTALHVHTTNSDGSDTLAQVVEEHYARGYDILAITDHDFLTQDWRTADNPRPGYTTLPLAPTRFAQIAIGEGRGGRPMLMIPYTNEQSTHEHANSFFVDHQAPPGFSWDDPHFVSRGQPIFAYPGIPAPYTLANLENTLQIVEAQNGLAHLNHPGRYTSDNSTDPGTIARYVHLFLNYPRCLGIEIINQKDRHPNDRILWDNINAQTIPQGRFVWGLCNDDTHSNWDTGYAFNVMMMPELSTEAFRQAMIEGSFYAVTRVAGREGINNPNRDAQTPVIHDITVTAHRVTISAEHHSGIYWIGEGGQLLGQGSSFQPQAPVGAFVRAHVVGPGGIAFTRPWHITPQEKTMRLVALMAENSTSERPGPFPNGTLLVVRNTKRLYYWTGGGVGLWAEMIMGAG